MVPPYVDALIAPRVGSIVDRLSTRIIASVHVVEKYKSIYRCVCIGLFVAYKIELVMRSIKSGILDLIGIARKEGTSCRITFGWWLELRGAGIKIDVGV